MVQRARLYKSLPLIHRRQEIRLLYLDALRVDTTAPNVENGSELLDPEQGPAASDLKHALPPLTGRIEVVSLATSPVYNALSYVWGGAPNYGHTIQCNGTQIPLTKNCSLALRALRNHRITIPIWIDAICINQDRDDDEKKSQLELMGTIYSFARTTYIWLGEASNTEVISGLASTIDVTAERARADEARRKEEEAEMAFRALARTLVAQFQYERGVLGTFVLSHPQSLLFWRHEYEAQPLAEARTIFLERWRRLMAPLQLE